MDVEVHVIAERDKARCTKGIVAKQQVFKYPDFVNIMHIYIVSHAIHNAKDIKFKTELRQHYRNEILASVNSNRPIDLKTRLGNPLLLTSGVHLEINDLWELGGTLAGQSGSEVSKMLQDDRVIKACFMSQVVWVCASNGSKDLIAATVLSGKLHPELEIFAPKLLSIVQQVLHVLGTCPEYIFDACPGFDKMLHIVHITDEVKFSEFSKRGFTPFRQCVDTCHSLKQDLATPLHIGNI
jgi:hypothetical protein